MDISIAVNISAFFIIASIESNGIILDCKYECQPNAPIPNALWFLAKLHALSINGILELFSINSVITASKN